MARARGVVVRAGERDEGGADGRRTTPAGPRAAGAGRTGDDRAGANPPSPDTAGVPP